MERGAEVAETEGVAASPKWAGGEGKGERHEEEEEGGQRRVSVWVSGRGVGKKWGDKKGAQMEGLGRRRSNTVAMATNES